MNNIYINIFFILFSIIILAIIFFVAVNLSFYNKPSLKFRNDEIDVSDVEFQYRNVLEDKNEQF